MPRLYQACCVRVNDSYGLFQIFLSILSLIGCISLVNGVQVMGVCFSWLVFAATSELGVDGESVAGATASAE